MLEVAERKSPQTARRKKTHKREEHKRARRDDDDRRPKPATQTESIVAAGEISIEAEYEVTDW